MTLEALAAEYSRRLTVLCAEDDAVTRSELAAVLERGFGTVITAADGEAAWALFRECRPDLVVTDLGMPRLDGLGLVARIREVEPDLPVIVTTAMESASCLLRAIELGVDHYVVKPLRQGALETALRKCGQRLYAEASARQARRLEVEAERLRHRAVLGQLFEGLAHDYNNLTQTLLAGVDLAQLLSPPGGEAHRVLAGCQEAAHQIQTLGRRLLILAHPMDRRRPTRGVPDLLRTTVLEVLQGSPARAEFDLAAGDPQVLASVPDLAEAFRHLAENAREALAAGGTLRVGARLAVKAEAEPASEHQLELTFRDDGPGIAPDLLPMVFEPYVSTKLRGARKGVGLGLALCQAIVRGHGGTLTVRSEPGSGAEFRMMLPMEAEPAGAALRG